MLYEVITDDVDACVYWVSSMLPLTWMVIQGWALAYRYYSSDYVRQEERASAKKRGIWQGVV